MVVQAHWVECYEARIASIALEHPSCTKTEARIMALKEACNTLAWQEKELRNRLYVVPSFSFSRPSMWTIKTDDEPVRFGVVTKRSRILGAGQALFSPDRGSIAFANTESGLKTVSLLVCVILPLVSKLRRIPCTLAGGTFFGS